MFTARKRSCGKVMFLHLFLSYSVHGGCLADISQAHSSLCKQPPDRHPPWPDTPPRQTPSGIATEAGSTHPTGMNSCFK